MEIKTTRRKK